MEAEQSGCVVFWGRVIRFYRKIYLPAVICEVCSPYVGEFNV